VPRIPYFWIRDVGPQTYMRVLKIARARKQSVADTARELLDRYVRMDEPNQKKPTKLTPEAELSVKPAS
jgi:hypothetical protein